MNVLGDTAYLSWQAVGDIDLDHYTLRFSPLTMGVTWSNAIDIVGSIAMDTTAVSVPAASGTYLLKAVDVGGRQSRNAATVISTIAGLGSYNAVLTLTEDPLFNGSHDGTAAADGILTLGGADAADDWPDVDTVENADIGLAGFAETGHYLFAGTPDLGAVYTSRLTADLSVAGTDFNSGIDSWALTDEIEFWDADVDPALWSLALELRHTADDPAGTPFWSDWTPFVVGDYTARAFQFRVTMESHSWLVTPALSRLRVQIDMPDRIASGRNLTSSAAGSAIAFDRPFRATPAIAVTAQDMASGDYYSITAAGTGGFSIRFFDSSGNGITRNFDYMAKGYGEQN